MNHFTEQTQVEIELNDDVDELMLSSIARQSTIASGTLAALNLIGQRLKDEFTLIELISESSSAAIYKAKRETTDKTNYVQFVAVKVFYPIVEKLMGGSVLNHEAQLLVNCRNHNIVKVLTTTIFWSDSFQFSCIIMEYVSGENLLEHCYRRKNLRERLALFYDICTAVTYLHSRPIVHGDLTPDNILVDDDGTVKIVDFTLGVTCRSVSEQTRGLTKLYASPLQLANGTATVSCDIYTLGKLLQDLLFGVWPVGSKSSIKIPFYMKASILSIIAKATEIEPDNRYISVESFSSDIHAVLTGFPIQSRKQNFVSTSFCFLQRQPVWSLVFLASMLALSKTYYDKSAANEKLVEEYKATASVTEKLSTVLKMANIQYSKGEKISASSIVEETRNITNDQTLPLYFRFNLLLKYGDIYLGNGDFSEAIINYEKAYQIAFQFVGSIPNITRTMLHNSVTKLALAYFENNHPLKARNTIEPHIIKLKNYNNLTENEFELLLAFFKINGFFYRSSTNYRKINVDLESIINSLLKSNDEIINSQGKAKLALAYATAVYYSFEGDAYSITSGKSNEYIEDQIIPTMRLLDNMLTKALNSIENTDHLFPDIAGILGKVKFEQRKYDEAVEYGQLAVRQAELIYQSTSHPSVQNAYRKYSTVIVHRRYDLLQPLLDKMFTSQESSKNSKLGLTTAFASAVWYSMGKIQDITKIKKLYNKFEFDAISSELGYIEMETIAITEYNLFILQSLPYPATSKNTHLKNLKRVTELQYGESSRVDPVAIARIKFSDVALDYLTGKNISEEHSITDVESIILSSDWQHELFIQFASLFANSGNIKIANQLLDRAVEININPNGSKNYSARMMVFNIGVAMVYSTLDNHVLMNEHLDEAISIANFNGLSSGVHIASIKYLEAINAYRAYLALNNDSSYDDFYALKDICIKILFEAGINDLNNPIIESLNTMSKKLSPTS